MFLTVRLCLYPSKEPAYSKSKCFRLAIAWSGFIYILGSFGVNKMKLEDARFSGIDICAKRQLVGKVVGYVMVTYIYDSMKTILRFVPEILYVIIIHPDNSDGPAKPDALITSWVFEAKERGTSIVFILRRSR